MPHINLLLIAVFKPILILLTVAATAALALPWLWIATDNTIVVEKLFQKTALLLLFFTALIIGNPFSNTESKLTTDQSGYLNIIAFSKSWLIGLLTLLPPIMLLLYLKVRVIDYSMNASIIDICKKTVIALMIGVAVGIVEEVIFRGWLLNWLQKHLKPMKQFGCWMAIIFSSLYFALLHFLKPDVSPVIADNPVTITTGLVLFINGFEAMLKHTEFWTLFALFLAGFLLAVVKVKITNRLSAVIGIHAAWVFCIKTTKIFTDANLHSNWHWLVSSDGINGILTTLWLALILLVMNVYSQAPALKLRSKSPPTDT